MSEDRNIHFSVDTIVSTCDDCEIPIVDALERDEMCVMIAERPLETDAGNLQDVDYADWICIECLKKRLEGEIPQNE